MRPTVKCRMAEFCTEFGITLISLLKSFYAIIWVRYIRIYHFAWEDQRELQGKKSYNALCTGQYLDIARESGHRGQYPDIARESGFHLSFEPLFDTKLS